MTKFDRRLLGTWKSDRRKTFLHYKPLKHFAPERFRKFRSLFGQMIIHWERGKFTITLKEMTNTTAYQVVAHDDCSVVIQSYDDLFDRESIKQIHFEGEDYYWIALDGGYLCEWFRRVGS